MIIFSINKIYEKKPNTHAYIGIKLDTELREKFNALLAARGLTKTSFLRDKIERFVNSEVVENGQ